MSPPKTKKQPAPTPSLEVDLGGGLALQVFGTQFEFTKRDTLNRVTAELICTKEQLEKMMLAAMSKGLLTAPGNRLAMLSKWCEDQGLAVDIMERVADGVLVISNASDGYLSAREMQGICGKAAELFPDSRVMFK